MVLTQSRWQRLWSDLVQHAAPLIAVPVAAWLTLHLMHHALREPFSLRALIASVALPPLALAVYELVMNSGAVHLPSAEIRWDEDGFAYSSFGDVTRIGWTDFRGYRRPWTPMGMIRLRSASHRDLRFPYLAFASEQREALFAELDRRALPNRRLQRTEAAASAGYIDEAAAAAPQLICVSLGVSPLKDRASAWEGRDAPPQSLDRCRWLSDCAYRADRSCPHASGWLLCHSRARWLRVERHL